MPGKYTPLNPAELDQLRSEFQGQQYQQSRADYDTTGLSVPSPQMTSQLSRLADVATLPSHLTVLGAKPADWQANVDIYNLYRSGGISAQPGLDQYTWLVWQQELANAQGAE